MPGINLKVVFLSVAAALLAAADPPKSILGRRFFRWGIAFAALARPS